MGILFTLGYLIVTPLIFLIKFIVGAIVMTLGVLTALYLVGYYKIIGGQYE